MARPLGEVTLSDEGAARTLERVVDAGMGFPVRGSGVPIGRGRHVDRAADFTQRWCAAQPTAATTWVYPYFVQSRHLVLRSLLVSQSDGENEAVVRPATDDRHNVTASYLSGVFRRVLSDFVPSLYDDLDFLGVTVDRVGEAHTLWQRTQMDESNLAIRELMDLSGTGGLDVEDRRRLAIRALQQVHSFRDEANVVWYGVPLVLEGPTTIRFYAVGVPRAVVDTLQPIVERPDISSLFRNALEVAIFLCAANVTRYVDRPFLSSQEFLSMQEIVGLAPHAQVAQMLVAALTSNDGATVPDEQLSSIFGDLVHRPYEGRQLSGRVILGAESMLRVDLRLADPLPFSDARLVRKVFEAQSPNVVPVARSTGIIGFGDVAPGSAHGCCRVTFTRGAWRLGQGAEEHDICSVKDGLLRPLDVDPSAAVVRGLRDVFGDVSASAVERFSAIFAGVREQMHGTMLIVAADAAAEAARLASSTTLNFVPQELSRDAVRALSNLDGALLLDPNGHCHGAGVIVDGASVAEDEVDTLVARSRGARFNSARRYRALCERQGRTVLIAVASADGYFDVLKSPRNQAS
jgi:hypothetical protein